MAEWRGRCRKELLWVDSCQHYAITTYRHSWIVYRLQHKDNLWIDSAALTSMSRREKEKLRATCLIYHPTKIGENTMNWKQNHLTFYNIVLIIYNIVVVVHVEPVVHAKNQNGLAQLLDWILSRSSQTIRELLVPDGAKIDSIPRHLSSFKRLEKLTIENNKVNMTIPRADPSITCHRMVVSGLPQSSSNPIEWLVWNQVPFNVQY